MIDVDSFQPLGRSLGRAHKFVRAWGDRELAPIGASVTDWILLFHIHHAPTPGRSQTEIAVFSDMGGPSLVRHLDRLEADGIVVRRRDTNDRRVVRLGLTAAGEARLVEIAEVMHRCDQTLRAQLTVEEQAVLARVCDRLFEFALGQLHAPTAPPPPPASPAKPARRNAAKSPRPPKRNRS